MVRPPYEIAVRLVGVAAHNWQVIDGTAALKGVDLLALPFDRFLNAIYAFAAERVKDRDQFDYQLTRPLPGRAKEVTAEELDADASSFMAFATAVGVPAPTSGRIERPAQEVGGA